MFHPHVTAHVMMLENEMTERGETQKLKKILCERQAEEESRKIITIDGRMIWGNPSKKQKEVHVVST